MSDYRWCPRCRKNVDIEEWTGLSILILIVLFLCGLALGIIYLVYKTFKTRRCPTCGLPEGQLEPPRFGRASEGDGQPADSGDSEFCIYCGARMPPGARFCPTCGRENDLR